VEYKSDASPLTKADMESNRIICTRLMELAPHVPIISEENKLLPYSIREVSPAPPPPRAKPLGPRAQRAGSCRAGGGG